MLSQSRSANAKGLLVLCRRKMFPAQGRIQDFFLGGGALVSCRTSTPINHIVFFLFFCRISVVLENRRSSRGGGAHPLHPPPRSAPAAVECNRSRKGNTLIRVVLFRFYGHPRDFEGNSIYVIYFAEVILRFHRKGKRC